MITNMVVISPHILKLCYSNFSVKKDQNYPKKYSVRIQVELACPSLLSKEAENTKQKLTSQAGIRTRFARTKLGLILDWTS